MDLPVPPANRAFGRLLRAAEGLTQWRSMLLGFLTVVACVLLTAASMYLSMRIRGPGGGLLAAVLSFAAVVLATSGFSGVGIMLMDKARGVPVRPMGAALLSGLLCLPKFIGFALVLWAVTLVLVLVGALVYLVCKLPFLGPVLLFVLHPVMVVAAAVVLTAIGWVAVPLFTPAVWDGRGFREALSLLLAVARTRLVQVVALLLGLYVVVMIIGMLVLAALFPGYVFMTGVAASVLGKGVMAGLPALMGGYGMGGGGLLVAGVLSSMLIFGVAMTLMAQVLLMGLNLVYLSAIDGVDVASGRQALEAGIARAREGARQAQGAARRAAEVAQQRAKEVAERTRQAVPQATAAAATVQSDASEPVPGEPQDGAAPSAAPALSQPSVQQQPPVQAGAESAAPGPLHCPQCSAVVEAGDLFCGTCGHRMH